MKARLREQLLAARGTGGENKMRNGYGTALLLVRTD
jgi:hypothetical protein